MASSRRLIASQTLSSSAASVTFSSIPSGYKDLILKVSARSDRASVTGFFLFQINSITSGYSDTSLRGTGTQALSARNSTTTTSWGGYISGGSTTSNTFGSVEVYIPSYAASQNKPIGTFGASEDNATAANINAIAGLVPTTAAVSSLVLTSLGDNFVSGSSFQLYGLAN